jgi:glycosyltransferase involved in cell wall biosynthesis
LAALEAMAHGVPVAAFAVGGLPELITDGVDGFLAPAGDLDLLAAKVAGWAALSRNGREAMARAARQTVAERYGRAAGVAAVRQAYAAALGGALSAAAAALPPPPAPAAGWAGAGRPAA